MPLMSREEIYLQNIIDGTYPGELPNPMSRNEVILQAIVKGTSTSELNPPQSREEDLLIQVARKIEQGGGTPIEDVDNVYF